MKLIPKPLEISLLKVQNPNMAALSEDEKRREAFSRSPLTQALLDTEFDENGESRHKSIDRFHEEYAQELRLLVGEDWSQILIIPLILIGRNRHLFNPEQPEGLITGAVGMAFLVGYETGEGGELFREKLLLHHKLNEIVHPSIAVEIDRAVEYLAYLKDVLTVGGYFGSVARRNIVRVEMHFHSPDETCPDPKQHMN